MLLHDYLDHRAKLHPDRELAVFGDTALSYADGADHVGRLAAALVDAGLCVGDRVAYLSKNTLEYGLFYFAASKAGVVPVPLNYRLVPREWSYIVADAGAKAIFAQSEFVDGIDSIKGELPAVENYVCVDEGRSGWDSHDHWLATDPLPPEDALGRVCTDAYQMYTSGTTGRPKGVVISQESLLCTLMQWRLALELDPGSRLLVVAPIYHAGGALTTMHAVASGGSTYVMSEFDAPEVARVLDEERIVAAMLVPAMIQSVLTDVPGVSDRGFSELGLLFYGASAISEATLRGAIETFGCEFVQAFGMTELPNLVYLTEEDHRKALAGRPELLLAAGRAGPGSAVKIVDENDKELPPGEVGEICGRGGQVMSQYWNLPEATAEALRGGWMHTGDAGYLDEEGYLYIKDRIKDMISSGAENVYPREVEDVLFEHPAIADVAVIGVPDERWGERVHAVVVLRDGASASGEELMEFCKGRIAGFKRPRSVSFEDELPRTASGKVRKQELRADAWADHDRSVG